MTIALLCRCASASTMDRDATDQTQRLEAQFEEIDRQIDALVRRAESCRKAMILSRAVILIGTLFLVLMFFATARSYTPALSIIAFAAIIGGTVWLGSNRTTRDETVGELNDLAKQKEKLFDEVAVRNGWRDLTAVRH